MFRLRMMLMFLFIFVKSYICEVVLFTVDENFSPMILSPSTGEILKKSSEKFEMYSGNVVQDDSKGCKYLIGGTRNIYEFDCSSLKQKEKNRYIEDYGGTITDMFFDNSKNTLYGNLIGYEGEMGKPGGSYILMLGQFTPPTFLRRHYTIKNLFSFNLNVSGGYSFGCYDSQNERISFYYSMSVFVNGSHYDHSIDYITVFDLKLQKSVLQKSSELPFRFNVPGVTCSNEGNHTTFVYTTLIQEEQRFGVFQHDPFQENKDDTLLAYLPDGITQIYPSALYVEEGVRKYVGCGWMDNTGEVQKWKWTVCDLPESSNKDQLGKCTSVGDPSDAQLSGKFSLSKKHF